jgi:hypothetical protein
MDDIREDIVDPLEEVPIDPEDLDDELDAEGKAKKKKDLIDEDTESLEDLEEDELEEDEESFDDVDEI